MPQCVHFRGRLIDLLIFMVHTLFRKDSHCGGGYGESPQELKIHPHSKEFLL